MMAAVGFKPTPPKKLVDLLNKYKDFVQRNSETQLESVVDLCP